MFIDVDEAVEVIVVFKKQKVLPSFLKWNGRTYKIEKVNLIHQTYEGSTLIHCFSVSDKLHSFKLMFNTKKLSWRLSQVYTEG